MSLRGETQPGFTAASFFRRPSDSDNEDDKANLGSHYDGDQELELRDVDSAQLETYIDGPTGISWRQMPCATPEDDDEIAISDLDKIEYNNDEGDDSDDIDIESTLSDQEDEQLDEAKIQMDQAFDEVLERQLMTAVTADEKGLFMDTSLTHEIFSKGYNLDPQTDQEAGRARAHLIDLQLDIAENRRHRHAMRARSRTMLTKEPRIGRFSKVESAVHLMDSSEGEGESSQGDEDECGVGHW